MKRAVVFWACRDPYYLKAAKHSARTAKRVMPDVDTVLLTDQDRHWRQFDLIITTSTPNPEDVCFPPLSLLPLHYDSGVYVGAKAHFCAPINDVFDLVEAGRVDIAMVHTSGKVRVDCLFPCPGVPEAFPHWRTALIAFRYHDQMRQFFARWGKEFQRLRRYGLKGGIRYPDQQPFRTALYHSDLTFATLPPNFCCTCHNVVVREKVRIIPYPKTANPGELAREANKHAPRVRLLVEGRSKRL